MIADIPQTKTDPTGTVSAILPYCRSENEVLRSAAIRALAAQGAGVPKTREALLVAILDEDPDVRSDAMEAMADHALSKDGPTLVASLEGDPVREVKLAAIRALASLKDEGCTQLLRDLMLSRCEGRVEWEDELGDWEDWLDIQIACIQTLGEMRATGMIEDMFNTLTDEFGQTLDIPVFTAFSKMGSDGVPWLLAQIEVGSDLSRKRAAQALLQAEPDAILEYVDVILASSDAQLKLLIVSVLPDMDDRLLALFQDNDPAVRSAVLKRLAKDKPLLAHQALTDSSELVQASALNCLQVPVPPDLHETLVDNAIAWLETAKTDLASAAAAVLPRLAPGRCDVSFVKVAVADERPLEVRVAVVRALALADIPDRLMHLTSLLSNAAQQVRVAALHGIKRLAEEGDGEAVTVLAEAITGLVLSPEDRNQKRETQEAAEVTAPKGDGYGPAGSRVRITPEGEIVTGNSEEPGNPLSTLASIQFEAMPEVSDTPEETSSKRRKRRAVEGPEAVGDDLSRVAITIAADLPDGEIETAILSRLSDADESIRTTAWGQLASRSDMGSITEDTQTVARSALEDCNPTIRLAAFQILRTQSAMTDIQAMALADEDALIRAAGVGMLQPDEALEYITDDAAAVRGAALERVLEVPNATCVTAAVDRLLQSERIDTLSKLFHRSQDAQGHAAKALVPVGIPLRSALVLLEVFAQSRTR